jgi:hypothetical protein
MFSRITNLSILYFFFGWVAFAIGPMSCAHPNRCSIGQENAKGILGLVILAGGGFGIPLAVGSLVGKAVKTNAVNHPKHIEDNENDYD